MENGGEFYLLRNCCFLSNFCKIVNLLANIAEKTYAIANSNTRFYGACSNPTIVVLLIVLSMITGESA